MSKDSIIFNNIQFFCGNLFRSEYVKKRGVRSPFVPRKASVPRARSAPRFFLLCPLQVPLRAKAVKDDDLKYLPRLPQFFLAAHGPGSVFRPENAAAETVGALIGIMMVIGDEVGPGKKIAEQIGAAEPQRQALRNRVAEEVGSQLPAQYLRPVQAAEQRKAGRRNTAVAAAR